MFSHRLLYIGVYGSATPNVFWNHGGEDIDFATAGSSGKKVAGAKSKSNSQSPKAKAKSHDIRVLFQKMRESAKAELEHTEHNYDSDSEEEDTESETEESDSGLEPPRKKKTVMISDSESD